MKAKWITSFEKKKTDKNLSQVQTESSVCKYCQGFLTKATKILQLFLPFVSVGSRFVQASQ